MRFSRHAFALLAFGAVTVSWLSPVLQHLSSALPGTHASDNVTFVWNIWWMRYALHHPDSSFFVTPFLFHPFGADLTLHAHTVLPAFVAAVAGPSSLLASQNLLIALHIYLNFVCSYFLAHQTTRQVLPALAGAATFGASAFVGAHLNGHFNLIAAWILLCLLTRSAAENDSIIRGGLAGMAVAAAAYIDYYLFVYAICLLALYWMSQAVALTIRRPSPSKSRRRALTAIAVLLTIDALLIAIILFWRGDRIDVGPLRISVRSINNPITAAWILAVAGGAIAAWSRVEITLRPRVPWKSTRVAVVAAGVSVTLLMPLLIHAARLWSEGRYVTQEYRWRSAPGGVDVASLLLGNPFHALWGGRVREIYSALSQRR